MKSLTTTLLLLLTCIWMSNAQPGGGKDLRLNGSSQYVNCGTINLSGGAITIQGWIKVQAFKTASPYITSFAGIEQSGNHAAVRIGDGNVPNDRVQFILRIGTSHIKLHSSQALTTNDWYHIAATYDGSNMKIYINGILDTIRPQTGSFTANSTFELGRNYASSRILLGELDEISVFKQALDQTTIREWMCKKITNSHPYYSDLEAYYPLNAGSGNTAYDESGNGYNGTIYASPQWKNSGAPIGDVSKYLYTTSAFNIGLSHPDGDSLDVNSTGGDFEGVHIYRIDSVPYVTEGPGAMNYLDTSRHWGIFSIQDAVYDIDYYYDGNANATPDCNLTFARRDDGGANDWDYQVPTNINYSNQIISYSDSSRNELILGISNNGPHTIGFDVDQPLCNGDANGSATVAVSGGTSPYDYSWSTGSTTTQSGNVSTGYVYVTITDDNNCESIDSVFVDEPTVISISSAVNDASCADTTDGLISTTATGGVGGYTYAWNDPNNSTTATINGVGPGNYTLTVTDSNGCDYTFNFEVGSIGPEPEPDLGGDTTVCEGISFGLTAGSQGGPFVAWSWSTGETGPLKVISGPGIYSITVENNNGCSASDTIEVSYVAPVQVDLGNNKTGVGSKNLDAGSGFISYDWSTNESTQTITVTSTGEYWVEVTDSNGCSSRDTVKVTITPEGIFDLSNNRLIAFPNPTNDVIQFNKPLQNGTINLLNIHGQAVKSFVATEAMNLCDVPSGTFILVVHHTDGHVDRIPIQKIE